MANYGQKENFNQEIRTKKGWGHKKGMCQILDESDRIN